MPPAESLAKPRSRPLPPELLATLRAAAEANRNYTPAALAASVRRDIERALIDEDGQEFGEPERSEHVAVLCEAIRCRVAQIKPEDEENLLWRGVDAGSPPEVFRKSWRRLLKSAQEALTHSADRVAGKFSVAEEKDEQDLVLPIHIVIDPLRLSNRLAANLGFGHMLAPKGSLQLEKVRAKAQIIPHIKREILANLDPIPLSHASDLRRNYRLFRIAQGPKRGLILGAQEIAGDDRLYVTTLPGAKRRVDHIEDQYIKELAQLARIQNKLGEINLLLKKDWPGMKVPRRFKALLMTLHGLVEELQFVIDDDKKKLHDAIEKAARLLVSKNKNAALACIDETRSNRLIDRRQHETRQIFAELAKDKLLVQGYIYGEEAALERLYEAVQEQKSEPRITNPEYPLTEKDRSELVHKLDIIIERCAANVRFQPNLSFSEKLIGHLTATAEYLDAVQPNRQAVAEEFMKAYVISKLARFHNFLLSIYEAFSIHGAYGVSVPEWKKELEEAERELNDHGVSKKIGTPEYDGIWQDLRKLIAAIKKAMNDYAKVRSEERRKEAAAEIKDLVASFNLPDRLGDTPTPLRSVK